jgi:NAD-dependent deacetylase
MDTEKINALRQIIEGSQNIVFFGGAGVSTESGIPDFRSADGIYNQDLGREVSPEEMISHTFFVRHTADFYAFYKDKLIYPEAKPNDCHRALADLERQGKVKAVVTQNIDGLHEMAGSKRVYDIHGSVLRNYCEKCGAFYGADKILKSPGVPTCDKCGGRIKPDVVLYEESLDENKLYGAMQAIAQADVLLVGGTSLVVYPASGLIRYFQGSKLVLINKSETAADRYADLVIRDPIAQVFRAVMGW